VLAAHGERIHPASASLANESSHIESDRTVDYRPVAGDGAARAAGLIAELL
jgi:hypothetical protein